MKFKLLLLLIAVNFAIYSQNITISGIITDEKTGESLIGANIFDANTLRGTTTNYYGFYSFKISENRVKLTFSYVGYQSVEIELTLFKDTILNISLIPVIELEEVVITDKSPINNVRSTQMSMTQLPVAEIQSLPVLLGEVDIIKSLQLMPGVQGGTEGTSGLYVRGGGPDQNLILLDGVPVYNVSHLFGLFSVFNEDAIKNVTLYKGGFPARFGGRLSSVVDIRMKEGNMNEFKANASIGLLASRVTIEGPIKKNKTSFIVSGRRSYIDLLSYPIQMAINKGLNDNGKFWVGYFLQDFNAKINHKFSDKSRLYFSTYFGKDKFFFNDKYEYTNDYAYIDGTSYITETSTYQDKAGIEWGNATAALRWNYIITNELFSNITCTYSKYKFIFFNEGLYESERGDEKYKDDYYYGYHSSIKDIALKADFDYIPNLKHYFRFGISNTLHYFSPGIFVMWESTNENANLIDTSYGNENIPSNEFYSYIEDEFMLGGRFKINVGIHYSNFAVKNKTYHSIEPRISGRFMINDELSFKASYVKMGQYLHLLSFSTLGLPTDLWVPSTKNISNQNAWQAATGFSYALQNQYEFSIEGFYKKMNDMITYEEGASFFSMYGDWETMVTKGKGESYGIEFFIRKIQGKTTGWLGYTLAWADRTFKEVSYGKTFPYNYDRRHDISIVFTHKFSDKFNVGLNWVFGTGYPFTLADEKFIAPHYAGINQFATNRFNYYPYTPMVNYFEHRNSYRMPNYHRGDIGINFLKQKKIGLRTWSFGVYNFYMHQNPFMIYPSYEYDWETNKSYKKLKQISFLNFIPYFKYNIDFNFKRNEK